MAEIDEYTTKKVFELRKNKQLGDAYKIASHLFKNAPNDEWTQKAYAWVLIDIIKVESTKNLEQAKNFYNQLNAIKFVTADDILSKQIDLLKDRLFGFFIDDNFFLYSTESNQKLLRELIINHKITLFYTNSINQMKFTPTEICELIIFFSKKITLTLFIQLYLKYLKISTINKYLL